VGILKLASVPAYLLDAVCALAHAAGRAPIDLEAERSGWRLFVETILNTVEILNVVCIAENRSALCM
jgi:hypothetical protein